MLETTWHTTCTIVKILAYICFYAVVLAGLWALWVGYRTRKEQRGMRGKR